MMSKVKQFTEKQISVVTNALDELGLALTNHKHKWSSKERNLYERATRVLNRDKNAANT
jgi:hypothetical protein